MSGRQLSSALYLGHVRHRRFTPRPHRFRYPLFMLFLDLGELDRVFAGRWLWSTRRPALAWFRRRDHFGDPDEPLDETVRDLVAASGGVRPAGPVRLLTHLRYAGHVMNPVSFYYCFDPTGQRVDAVVAEVTNTPWGERHGYVLTDPTRGAAGDLGFETRKAFHVSPFLPMDMRYRWRLTPPGERLAVHMENHAPDGARVFDATLALRRRPITGRSLAFVLVRYPLMTLRVIAWIYLQAGLLAVKRMPFFEHPAKAASSARDG